ncbi:hypothetical protein M422DRAFT_258014 [Sphaerobolus stellatus SS14]|uniref:Uncharacterized protein n=1 Tax=Sphaerobolus stellatus (strain SS14) TaxID=990650 RepID=A0A0C9VMG5_SPHS4|nr:hypothetical protein M422DRAFT_258014 [Sphaerobolus stellatus SS14]
MSMPVPITAAQLEALRKVRDILQEAGLLISPPSTEEILAGRNRTTSQGYTQKFIRHPENVIVEYPETGNLSSEAVAHIFPYQPDEQEDFDPKLNIQYGIWGKHGSRKNVRLFLLSEEEEKPLPISHQFKGECMGVKKCAYTGILPTLSVNVQHPSSGSMRKFVDSAQHEVFMKTLGFFCALMQNGCLFNPEVEEDEDEDSEDEEDTPESTLLFYESLSDIRSRKPGDIQKCDGKLVFKQDEFGHPFIQCENRQKGHQAHLIIRNLNEFNLEYLRALCTDELATIMDIEEKAGREGYGPLIPWFEGILTMVEENSLLPPEQVYVRSAEKIDIPGEGSFSLIICMFKAMNTFFKRIHRWQEFKIEAWFPEYSWFVVIACAFTTSQSAKAHKVLFQRIFAIVEADTGQQVQFRHIHGTGWDTIIADEHRGQA